MRNPLGKICERNIDTAYMRSHIAKHILKGETETYFIVGLFI